MYAPMANAAGAAADRGLAFNQVQVLKQEAVGMYEVTVLAAGSAQALQRWMDDHGYQYPHGMDQVVNDYVKLGWVWVAERTRVGDKAATDPRPGMRSVNTQSCPPAPPSTATCRPWASASRSTTPWYPCASRPSTRGRSGRSCTTSPTGR